MGVRDFFKAFFKGDGILWFCYLALVVISIVEMYSASSTLAFRAVNYNTPIQRHVILLLVGVALAIFIHRSLSYRYIPLFAILGYFLSLGALMYVLVLGIATNGAARWINIGPIQFQPSELAKLSTVLLLASVLGAAQHRKKYSDPKYFLSCLLIWIVPSCLILVENLSTAALLTFVCSLMMIFSGPFFTTIWLYLKKILNLLRTNEIFRFTVLAMLVGGLFLLFYSDVDLKDTFHRATTWSGRVVNFFTDVPLDDSFEITDKNRQESHARIAISNGRYFGMGIGDSEQRDFLSQAFSDFIFAIIVEEMGVFSLIVVFIYLLIFYRAIILIKRLEDPILCYILLGLSLMLLVQAYFHVAVSLGCVPVTGQPLPIISRGGTSILIFSVYFGLMLNISRTIFEDTHDVSSNGKQSVAKRNDDEENVKLKD